MNEKTWKLEKLRWQITNNVFRNQKKDDVWFYPDYNGVKGYMGTDNIIVVGPNPSLTGDFPEKPNEILYDELKKCSLQNSHLTDFIKIRISNSRVDKFLKSPHIKSQIKFFEKEVKILNTKIIFLLGDRAKRIWNDYFRKLKILTICITHPSKINFGRKENVIREEYNNKFSKIREILKNNY